jgi:transposase
MGTEAMMSLKEADRYAVIQQVIRRGMAQADAALWLGISVRQVKRLASSVRQDGARGVISKRRGVPSNRSIPVAERERVLELLVEHYADFGPSLAAEYLAQRHGYRHSAETLRGWMVAAGLWKPKRVRARQVHSPRERRARLGELVQIDGSPHAWFEARGPRCSLVAFIDDATGSLMHARFYPVESTAAYLDSLQRYVGHHGRPLALYSDRHSIFTKHDPEDPQPTQFERALTQLNIESILAYTPQAKGRVERLFQTLQDRLVKAMRLAGIDSIEQANAWLERTYVPAHNARFARQPSESGDAHRPWHGQPLELARICAHHYERTLSKALTCQFKGSLLVVLSDEHQPRYGLRNKRVLLVEHLGGQLEMLCADQKLTFKAFERHQHLSESRVSDDKTLNGRVEEIASRESSRLKALHQQVARENAARQNSDIPMPGSAWPPPSLSTKQTAV